MAFGKLVVAVYIMANVALGKHHFLTGTTEFFVQRGQEITVTGYYKYCLDSTNCPSCIRQIYLNLFTRSVCLASLSKSQLDCKEHHFTQKFIAPSTAGSYDIKMEERLDYNCIANRVSSSGATVGKVMVQEPPFIVNKSSSPTVFTGDSLILHCSALGYPQPVVRWYKDGNFVHENTSLLFSSLNQSDSGFYTCNASSIAGSDAYKVQVLVRERRPILKQSVAVHNADELLQNDSVEFTVFLTHDVFSRDHAWNAVLVWILPHYATFLSHVPKTNITLPHPGEYNIDTGQIQLGASMEINITVQIDPKSKLSVGRHFLSIPTHTIYEQRMAGGATKMSVGSVESVTVNFTVREGGQRSFLVNPFSNDVYFCKTKVSDQVHSCYVSSDGTHWTGIDPRVKFISGMILRGLYKKIFATTSDDRCHVVSEDGLIWSCIVSEDWRRDSSSDGFVYAIMVPRNLKSHIPQVGYIASNSDGTISYGGSGKGLHKKEKNGIWRLVVLWDCT